MNDPKHDAAWHGTETEGIREQVARDHVILRVLYPLPCSHLADRSAGVTR